MTFSLFFQEASSRKNLMNLHNILWKFIDKFFLFFCICPNNPEHKFMLLHLIDILVHPCRNTAEHIRITPFQTRQILTVFSFLSAFSIHMFMLPIVKRPFDTAVIIFIRTQCTHLPVLRSADTDSQQLSQVSTSHTHRVPLFILTIRYASIVKISQMKMHFLVCNVFFSTVGASSFNGTG